MDAFWATVEAWQAEGEAVALATVVETWRSSPRTVGSKLAVTASGRFIGSVSAGCVEGAVIAACAEVLKEGRPRLLRFGVTDETAWDVGLSCGGTIRIWVAPLDGAAAVADALRPRVVATVLDATARVTLVVAKAGVAGSLPLDDAAVQTITAAAQARLYDDVGQLLTLADGTEVFLDVYPVAPKLVVVGAVHMAEPLVRMAAELGFATVVVDPRTAFANRERFPTVGTLLTEWPEEAFAQIGLDPACYVVTLSHDPKFDDPALIAALASPAAYVGALGSKRTHAQRLDRLRAVGVSEAALARLHAPVGLPLGGVTPAEIALSILAEITQVRRKRG